MKMKAENTYRINGQLYGNGYPLDEKAIDKAMGISGDAPSRDRPAEPSPVDKIQNHSRPGVPRLHPGYKIHAAPPKNQDPETIKAGPGWLIGSNSPNDQPEDAPLPGHLTKTSPISKVHTNGHCGTPELQRQRNQDPKVPQAGHRYIIESQDPSDCNDNPSNPGSDSESCQRAPEVLGEGLANLADREEDLLDDSGYKFIVRSECSHQGRLPGTA